MLFTQLYTKISCFRFLADADRNSFYAMNKRSLHLVIEVSLSSFRPYLLNSKLHNITQWVVDRRFAQRAQRVGSSRIWPHF